MGWTSEESWFDFKQRQEISVVSETSRSAVQSMLYSVKQVAGDLLRRLMQPGRENDS